LATWKYYLMPLLGVAAFVLSTAAGYALVPAAAWYVLLFSSLFGLGVLASDVFLQGRVAEFNRAFRPTDSAGAKLAPVAPRLSFGYRAKKRVLRRYTTARRDLPGKGARNALLRLHGPILALLESAVIADDPDLKREIIEFPASSELESVEMDLLVLLLRTAASNRRASRSAALGLERVGERCMRALTARLNEPSQRAVRPTTGRCRRLPGVAATFAVDSRPSSTPETASASSGRFRKPGACTFTGRSTTTTSP
jgi:hypothetical protein